MQNSRNVTFYQPVSHRHGVSKSFCCALDADHAVGVSGLATQLSWQVGGMSNQELVALFNDREIAIS